MKKVIVDTEGFLPDFIEKDLTDNQKICPDCKGLGLKVRNFPYGNDEGKVKHPNKMFPWNNKYIGFCDHCYFGVQELCPYCHEIYKNKGIHQCDCEGYRAAEHQKEQKKVKDWYEKATKLTLQEAKDKEIGMLFNYFNDKYYVIDDVLELLDEEKADAEFDGEDFIMPKWLFGTSMKKISVDSRWVLENATDDLHEDASENLANIDELEKFLEAWCEKQSGTDTYYPDYKIVVLLEGN